MKKFKFINTPIQDLYIVESLEDRIQDTWETYNEEFAPYIKHLDGSLCTYIQDNESKSMKSVLRGIHMQVTEPQGKLVRVLKGKVYDVAVDARIESKSFGKWCGVELSDENRRQLLIPEGFLHGFYVMSDEAVFAYKCTRNYFPDDEYGVMWDDPNIAIKWPIDSNKQIIIAEKDNGNHSFKELEDYLLEHRNEENRR